MNHIAFKNRYNVEFRRIVNINSKKKCKNLSGRAPSVFQNLSNFKKSKKLIPLIKSMAEIIYLDDELIVQTTITLNGYQLCQIRESYHD
jgi:hypothetical protein